MSIFQKKCVGVISVTGGGWCQLSRNNCCVTREWLLFQRAQSAKGKASEKSPVEEQPPTTPASGSDAATIDQQIADQGNRIRILKGEKAAKVCSLVVIIKFSLTLLETLNTLKQWTE